MSSRTTWTTAEIERHSLIGNGRLIERDSETICTTGEMVRTSDCLDGETMSSRNDRRDRRVLELKRHSETTCRHTHTEMAQASGESKTTFTTKEMETINVLGYGRLIEQDSDTTCTTDEMVRACCCLDKEY